MGSVVWDLTIWPKSQIIEEIAEDVTMLRVGLYFLCPSAESSPLLQTSSWRPPSGHAEERDSEPAI